LAIILALLTGLMVVFPQLLFLYQSGEQYQGINIFETDSEYFYVSRIREVYDGHYKIANPILAEGKNLPYAQQPLSELIVGFTGIILHLNISSVLILFRFISPFFLFLIIYFFILNINGRDKITAILAPIVIILASNLISYPLQLLQMLKGNFFTTTFLDYARPINPQISSIFFFGFLYSFWQLGSKSSKRYLYFCAALFGLSFYVYVYTWTFLFVFIGIEIIISLFSKKLYFAKKCLYILFFGGLLAIPYFINTYQLIHHFSYPSLQMAYGFFNSHKPVFGFLVALSLFLLIGCYYLNENKNRNYCSFFLGLVLSGFVVTNQQVITGKVMQYGHYHWNFNRPILIIVGLIFLFNLFHRLKLRKMFINILFIAILFIAFFNSFNVQYHAYQSYFDKYLFLQKYDLVIDWLNHNAQKDDIVYVPESYSYPISGINNIGDMPSRMLSRFITSYTSLNLYYFTYANLSLSPYPKYSEYNLLITLKLLDVKPQNAFLYLRNNSAILGDIYMFDYEVRGLSYRDVPDQDLDNITRDYRDFYALSWSEIFSKYPLNYIVWDTKDLPSLPFDKIMKDENLYFRVFEVDGINIYKII